MNNIDYFTQDAAVGDSVIIELTSGKSVSGKVIEIGDSIIIEKENGIRMRLLDAIIGGWEISEKTIGSDKDTSNIVKPVANATEVVQTTIPGSTVPEKEDTQTGLKIVGKIDLSQFEKHKKKTITEHSGVKTTVNDKTDETNSASKGKTKNSIGNASYALKQINKRMPPKRSSLSLSSMGRITQIGPQSGFILANETQDILKFEVKDIVGEASDYSRNDDVVYTISPNIKGKKQAIKVLNIMQTDDLIGMAKSAIENEGANGMEKAKDILNYILKEYPKHDEAIELRRKYLSIEPTIGNIVKPEVVISQETQNALPLSLPVMSEYECKEKERELDLLIRNGQREECLQQSYNLLSKHCPTPKYLKSYLDRIVNTEVALDHTQQAIDALGQLIAYSESQDTKATNLSHLYISLARLLKKQGQYIEATKALNCAEILTPSSLGVQNMRALIQQESESNGAKIESAKPIELEPEFHGNSSIVVSKMLQQDVECQADSVETEDADSTRLLGLADGTSKDSTKSFELRAQLYLNAAASFYKKGMESCSDYKKAVASYARLKGNSMFRKLQNSIHKFPENCDELIAFCDSACNYYTEALGIYNEFGQKRHLQELFLKYLKLRKVSSQIQGGKTPDPDWSSGTLKSIMKECLNDVNTEDFNAFANTCISVGCAAEDAWNSLAFDKDGIGPFMAKLSDITYRKKVFGIFNTLEQSDIDCNLKTNEFMHGIFAHHQGRIKLFGAFLADCIKWPFSQFEIEIFKEQWQNIEDYSDILLTTDLKAVDSINQVIKTLLPYAEVNDANRMERLISSQQTLLKSINIINDTTTFYGRTFFYQIENRWLKNINSSIEEKYAEKQPRLIVEPDPHFIKIAEDDSSSINFVVINRGESTADSFVVRINYNNSHQDITYGKTVDAGKSIPLNCPFQSINPEDSTIVKFEVTTNYNGRTLSPTIFEYTYEKDSNVEFKTDIPWKIDGTPEKNVFVGRQETLEKLIRHYSSKERSHTYIMYGLTRTGKTSILDYLREEIEGQPLDENPAMTIKAFSWPFQNVAYKKDISGINENRFWEYLIKTSLYDTLPEPLQDIIDSSYDDGDLPKVVGQNDFLKIIDIMNANMIMPFFTIDEFSNVKLFLDSGTLNASFLSILRDLSLNGKACFIYAGTYDIEELPRNKEYGLTGQLVHTYTLPIDRISNEDADKLIDSWNELVFEPRAKEYIKSLSGCVPYWIQWICLDCGKYAIGHNYHHLGYSEVNKVVQILTGEASAAGDKTITWGKIDITNFQQNQYMSGEHEDAECAVISCIAYLNRNNTEHARGVSIKDMQHLWNKHYVSKEFQGKMVDAIKRMSTRHTLNEYTDEGRVVYKLNVDLFRRYWYVKYPNISTYLTSK